MTSNKKPEGVVPYNVWLLPEQRAKLRRIGGARWLRKMIEAQSEDKPTWSSEVERQRMIVEDIRNAKVVARMYDVSPKTVSQYRYAAKLRGKPVANFRIEEPNGSY